MATWKRAGLPRRPGSSGTSSRSVTPITLTLNPSLIRLLAILRVDLVDRLHSRHDLAEGRESLAVQRSVVREVDEDLRRPRVRAGGGEGDRAPAVALRHGIVVDVCV